MSLEERKEEMKKMVDKAANPELAVHQSYKRQMNLIILDAIVSFSNAHEFKDLDRDSISLKELGDWIKGYVNDRFTRDEDI